MIASRHAILSMGLGDTNVAQYAKISRHRVATMAGDPFLGGFGRAIGGLGKLIGKGAKALIRGQLGIHGGEHPSQMRLGRGFGMGITDLQTLPPATQGALALPTGVGIMAGAGGGFEFGKSMGRRLGERMFGGPRQAFRGPLAAAGLVHMRRHRRMRVTNVRALNRAFRRVRGFAKLAHKVISFTHRVRMKRHAPRGRPYRRRTVR